MGPSTLVAETEHLERSDSEDLAVWRPLNRCDDVVVGERVVQLTAELIPDTVLAVFTGRDDEVVGGVPVASEDNTIVRLPLDLLVTWEGGLNDQVLVAAVQDGIAVWGPDETIDRLASLDHLGTEHTSA